MKKVQHAITLWFASVTLTLMLAFVATPHADDSYWPEDTVSAAHAVLPDNPLPALLPETAFEPLEPVLPRTRHKLPKVQESDEHQSLPEYCRHLTQLTTFPQALTRAPPALV